MAIPVVETVQGSGFGGVSAPSMAVPAGIVADDILIIIMCAASSSGSPIWDDTTNKPQTGTWTLIGTTGSGTPDTHIAAWWSRAVGGESAVVVQCAITAPQCGMYFRISGALESGDPIDTSALTLTGSAGGNPQSITGITTGEANTLALYGISLDGGDTLSHSVDSAWTESLEIGGTNTGSAGITGSAGFQDIAGTSTASGTADVTYQGGNEGCTGIVFNIKEEPSAGGISIPVVQHHHRQLRRTKTY